MIIDKLKPYLPYLLVPIFILYALDFITLIIHIAEIITYGLIVIQSIGFLFGIVVSIADKFPNHKTNPDVFRIRIIRYIMPFKWGYDLSNWLIESDKKEEIEKEICKLHGHRLLHAGSLYSFGSRGCFFVYGGVYRAC